MVTFGAAEGKVVAASHTMLTVLSPAHMAATNITVKVHVAAVTGEGVPADDDGEHDGGHSGHRRLLESLGHMHRGAQHLRAGQWRRVRRRVRRGGCRGGFAATPVS